MAKRTIYDIVEKAKNVEHKEIVYLKPEDIDIDFEEQPTKEFVESVKRFGILTPIEVIKSQQDGKYKLLDGRRRLTTAKLLGLETIPAVIVETDMPEDIAQIVGNVINLQRRENKNMLADSIFKLKEKGYSLSQIAKLLGLKPSLVQEYLILYQLPEELKQAIVEGKVSPRTAKKIFKLSPQERMKLIGILKEKGKITRTDIKEVRSTNDDKSKAVQTNLSSIIDIDEDDNVDNDIASMNAEMEIIRSAMKRLGLGEKFISKITKQIEKELDKFKTNKLKEVVS